MAIQNDTSNRMAEGIRGTWGLFFQQGNTVEVRIFLKEPRKASLWSGFGSTLSGYFDDHAALVDQVIKIEKFAQPEACYMTINPVDLNLIARAKNRFVASKRGEATADKDIVRRLWIMVDFDPIRAEGISANAAELAAARERMQLVRQVTTEQGWATPVTMFSGNGYHLFYPIDIANDDISRDLVKHVLLSFQLRFSDKQKKTDLGSELTEGQIGVKIDNAVYNAARITKLYGTWARKGDPVDGRDHRQSFIEDCPQSADLVSIQQLQAEAQIYLSYEIMLAEEKAKPQQKPLYSTKTPSLIARFNQENAIESVLASYGYKHAHGDRWVRPGGKSSSVLVDKESGKTFHFNQKDPMFNGHRHDAFDFETKFKFNDNQQSALDYWAAQYGVILRSSIKARTIQEPPMESTKPDYAGPRTTFRRMVSNLKAHLIKFYDQAFAIECLFDNDAGDARLLHRIAKGWLVFDHADESWYWYNGLFWEKDSTTNINYLVAATLTAYYEHLSAMARVDIKTLEEKIQDNGHTDEDAKALKNLETIQKASAGRAKETCTVTKVRNVLIFVKAGEWLGIVGDEWDRDIRLLATQNAVINIVDRSEVEPFAGQYLKIVAPVIFDPEATYKLWQQTIMEICNGNEDKYNYIKRQLGYAFSGEAKESDFFMWYGKDGRNGKELILGVVHAVLGDQLSGPVEAELFLANGSGAKNSATEALLKLRGRRVAWVSENNVGRLMDTAAMKALSGGVRLTGRHNFGRQIEWQRTHTIIYLTNHTPRVNSQSGSEWDRIKRLDFTESFVNFPDPGKPWEHEKDKDRGDKIINGELSGVLNWLLEGYQEYRAQGLNEPDEVTESTAQYKRKEDTLGEFLSNCCLFHNAVRVKRVDLYRVYAEHADGDHKWGKRRFFDEIEGKPGIKLVIETGIWWYSGIGLSLKE